jgi:acetyltransferase
MEHLGVTVNDVLQATLRDGRALIVRPIRGNDAPFLQGFFSRLSPESIYLRFLCQKQELTDVDAAYFATIDYQARMALVAIDRAIGENNIVAVVRYDKCFRDERDVAEAAIVIEDEYQSQGLGVFLIEQLAAHARMQGIQLFHFSVHYSNVRMLRLIERIGQTVSKKQEDGVLEIRCKLADRPAGTALSAAKAHNGSSQKRKLGVH